MPYNYPVRKDFVLHMDNIGMNDSLILFDTILKDSGYISGDTIIIQASPPSSSNENTFIRSNPETEEIIGDETASQMLGKSYRAPWNL